MDTPRRKSRKPNKYLDEVGVVGRKTGITISGDVTKNADGLEDVDAFFEAANSTTKIDETTNSLATNIEEAVNSTAINIDEATNSTTTNIDEVANSTTTNIEEVSMSLVTDDSPQETYSPHKNTTPLEPEQPSHKNTSLSETGPPSKKKDGRITPLMIKTKARVITKEEIRRSKRQRIKPLEFWRNERIVYGPTKTEIIRIPRPDDNESGVRRDTKKRKRSNKKTTLKKGESEGENIDEAESAEGLTIDWETKEKVTRRLIYTLSMYQTEAIDNDEFKFQKTFSE
ncbi:15405_t:CDS:2, partial [Racocetra persica]